MKQRMMLIGIAAGMVVLATAGPLRGETAPKPVKVFILAGQSNMEGQGVVAMDHEKYYNGGKGNLVHTMKSSPHAKRYAHLKDKSGKWVERKDVWVSFQTEKAGHKTGPLTIGYTSYGGKAHMGPELQFGHVIGDHYDQQVLLIKTAWGGKSLYKDFRPPSCGGTVGPYYTKMIAQVRGTLSDLKKLFPDYAGQGYEIAGFVWFQGWNDMCAKEAIPQYTKNLVNLIKDVRKEFKLPKLPVVIGELGNGGEKANSGNMAAIRTAQADAAKPPEFKGNVIFVKTAQCARPAKESPNTGHGHHWFGNAESYFLIGQALADGMKKLLPTVPVKPTR
jgi:hypothetical protein